MLWDGAERTFRIGVRVPHRERMPSVQGDSVYLEERRWVWLTYLTTCRAQGLHFPHHAGDLGADTLFQRQAICSSCSLGVKWPSSAFQSSIVIPSYNILVVTHLQKLSPDIIDSIGFANFFSFCLTSMGWWVWNKKRFHLFLHIIFPHYRLVRGTWQALNQYLWSCSWRLSVHQSTPQVIAI